ncbi:MAG: hypothetical protein HY304_07015 [candidate division Zixibacteria bacterium]|nr:hypothetical protein [candidate division Zixibacteria bacterium]
MESWARLVLGAALFLCLSCGGDKGTGGGSSQTWEETFPRSGSINAIVRASDGGYIAVGTGDATYSYSPHVFVFKIDSTGHRVWEDVFGTTGLDVAAAIAPVGAGGYIIAGTINTQSERHLDASLIRVDVAGNRMWEKTYGGLGDDQAFAVSSLPGGGFVFAGVSDPSGRFQPRVWVVAVNADGNTLWNRTYGDPYAGQGNAIAIDPHGSILVAGAINWPGVLGFPGSDNVFLARLNQDGDTTWQRTFGGSEADSALSIALTSDGGCVMAGETYSFGQGMGDVYLLDADSSGNRAWQRTFGWLDWDRGNGIAATLDGGYAIAGTTRPLGSKGKDDAYVVKTDGSGHEAWERTFGVAGNDGFVCVLPTPDGGYLLGGYKASSHAGQTDFYLVKTDSHGNL